MEPIVSVVLPENAHQIIDVDGHLVGVEIGGVSIDGADFNQQTVDALVSSISNTPSVDDVIKNITN